MPQQPLLPELAAYGRLRAAGVSHADAVAQILAARPAAPAPAPRPRPRPQVRAATTVERVNDRAQDVYEAAAASPAGKLADLLGVSDLAGMVRSFSEPAEVLMGAPVPLPGELVAADLVSGARKGIRAYHGSPHDFDRFDLSKIGTGEGAQSYGHGLYFAENEGVAEDYFRNFTDTAQRTRPTEYGGVAYPGGTMRQRILARLAEKGRDATIADLEASIRANSTYAPDMANLYRGELEFVKHADLSAIKVPKAHRYEVAIKADPAHFLDWDQPLRAQTSHVQQAVTPHIEALARHTQEAREALLARGRDSFGRPLKPERLAKLQQPVVPPGDRVGSDLYRQMGFSPKDIPRDQEEGYRRATAALREAGVPGIKYLDQGSRLPVDTSQLEARLADLQSVQRTFPGKDPTGVIADKIAAVERDLAAAKARTPTSNYVVFDDSLIDILRKYGWLPPAAGLAAAQDTHGDTTTP